MSGGRLNYFYSELQDHAKDLGDKELDHLVSDLAELFHDREWFLSGDTCEGEWRMKKKAFKEKWFMPHGRQDRIETYLEEFSREIREELGISKEYCVSCVHFTPDEKSATYGHCEFETYCMTHIHDRCDKWDEGI